MSSTRLRAWGAFLIAALLCGAPASYAQQPEPDLGVHLDRLVNRLRGTVPNLPSYQPLLVLNVLHDGGGYRVQASGRLERRLVESVANAGLRVIDQASRRQMLEQLRRCYTEQRPLCQPEQVIGSTHPAAGLIEGYVQQTSRGTRLRVRLVAGREGEGYSIGEVVATAQVEIPEVALASTEALRPVRGTVSIGLPAARSDTGEEAGRGQLSIAAQTATDVPAWVHIDGRGYGAAPVQATVEPGHHLVTITAEGHQPRNEYVRVSEGGATRRRYVLRRGVGAIRIRANTSGARAYIDGRMVGETPTATSEVPSGPHAIRVEKEGFDPYSTRLQVEHGDTVRVEARLREHPGEVLATCTNDSLAVYLDERRRGLCTTADPVRIAKVSAGSHKIYGRRGKRRSQTHSIHVRGDEVASVKLTLQRRPADEETEGEETASPPDSAPGVVYATAGYLQGRATGDITYLEQSGRAKVTGRGFRLAVSGQNEGWGLSVGVDALTFGPLAMFQGKSSYLQAFFRIEHHLFPRAFVHPYAALHGQIGVIKFRPEEDGRNTVSTQSSGGVGGVLGLEARLAPRLFLLVGGEVTTTDFGTIDARPGSSFVNEPVGKVSGWWFRRGFVTLRFGIARPD